MVTSETRTNEKRSSHMHDGTAVMLRIGTEDDFIDVSAPCCGPCASVMVCTSYINYVSETQNHIYEEGNDAGVGVRRRR